MQTRKMRRVTLFLWFLAAVAFPAGNLLAQPALQLDTVAERRGHPVIHISLGESVYQQIVDVRGSKLVIKDADINLDGHRARAEEIKLRGQSSLNYRRKSFTVDLDGKSPLPFEDGPVNLSKFYLVSLNMDHHYFHNKLAYACLEKLGLFGLHHGYVELRINGNTEGIYLMMQRPEDFLMDDLDAEYFLRRGYDNAIDEDEASDDLDEKLTEACRQRFQDIYLADPDLQGEELYTYLSERLNLRAYMRWMAFNYLVRNGDYSDEVYFYLLEPEDSLRFDLMGWDYDDIFMEAPHEGANAKETWLGDKLIFSGECTLDRRIGNDPYLYKRYLEELQGVLQELDPEWLAQACTGIYAQLSSFYRKKAIIRMAEYDRGKFTSKEALAQELRQTYSVDLLKRREETFRKLKAMGI